MGGRQGWIGVDLDGTLAFYDSWHGIDHIGAPIPLMIERVRNWIEEGRKVKIMTARVCSADPEINALATSYIYAWCRANGLPELEVTASKDFNMVELWDDRAIQVIFNTGVAVRAPE